MNMCIRIVWMMMLCMLTHQWSENSAEQTCRQDEQPSSVLSMISSSASLLSELHPVEHGDSDAYKHLRMQTFCLETCFVHHYNVKHAIKHLNKIVDKFFHQHPIEHLSVHTALYTLVHPVDYYIFGLKRILI